MDKVIQRETKREERQRVWPLTPTRSATSPSVTDLLLNTHV